MEKGKSPTPAGGRGAFLARHLDFAGMVWSGRQQGVAMRLLGNILWHFPCFGFVTSLFSFLAGILLTVTVVGAPIGLGLIQYAKFALAPYSYSMIDKRELHPNKSGNILYFFSCGALPRSLSCAARLSCCRWRFPMQSRCPRSSTRWARSAFPLRSWMSLNGARLKRKWMPT